MSRHTPLPADVREALLKVCFAKWREPGRWVYFIGAEDGGPVKIGVSNNPRRRLSMLRCETGRDLSILATAAGGLDIEDAYHLMFEASRTYGEWFDRSAEIDAEIARLNGLRGSPKILRNAFPDGACPECVA
jgi:hypothetical protein